MTIDIHFHAASVAELHLDMHAFLIGHANRGVSAGAIVGNQAGVGSEPKQTAAEKKALEKAAKELAAAAQQSIQTGGERTNPEADKADAKDEAADTKAATPEPLKLTHDSVRAVLGGYVQAYGMAAAQEDGSKLIGIAKISEIPDNPKALAAAIIAIAQGIEKNPFKRDPAGDGLSKEKTDELKPIVTAAVAVK